MHAKHMKINVLVIYHEYFQLKLNTLVSVNTLMIKQSGLRLWEV
jgi:hypothetical protein